VSLSVVKERLKDHDVVTINEVNESMFRVDSSRPTLRQNVSERFRFADSFKRGSYRNFNQTVEAFEHRLIVALPKVIVLPTKGSEDQSH